MSINFHSSRESSGSGTTYLHRLWTPKELSTSKRLPYQFSGWCSLLWVPAYYRHKEAVFTRTNHLASFLLFIHCFLYYTPHHGTSIWHMTPDHPSIASWVSCFKGLPHQVSSIKSFRIFLMAACKKKGVDYFWVFRVCERNFHWGMLLWKGYKSCAF